jgi:hypothetical protein
MESSIGNRHVLPIGFIHSIDSGHNGDIFNARNTNGVEICSTQGTLTVRRDNDDTSKLMMSNDKCHVISVTCQVLIEIVKKNNLDDVK